MIPDEPRQRPAARVWALTVLVAVAALVMLAGLRHLGTLPGTPVTIRWWGLAPMFFLAELAVVHFGFRQHAHTYSMSELPLVIGLVLAAPTDLVAGQVVGSFLALVLVRRQPPAKLAFNIAQFSLQTMTAVFVFRTVVGDSDPLGLPAALGVLASALAAFLSASVLVNIAIRLAGGRLGLHELAEILALGTVSVVLNSALALAAVNIIWLRPEAAWIAGVPPLVLFLAYRAYAGQRSEHARLIAMYDATIELHRMGHIEDALAAVTARARALFNSRTAEIAVLGEPGGETVYLTATGPDDLHPVMRPLHREILAPPLQEVLATGQPILRSTEASARTARRNLIAVPLYEREVVTGVFAVRDPLGDVGGFGPADLKLLSTIAGQVSVSLDRGRLVDSLAELTALKEELHTQATHDGLTGLANRNLLLQRLADAARTGAPRTAALLFLDLDDFKRVNDGHGHTVGDELLTQLGRRLETFAGTRDTVARLGGDEFAVLLRDLDGDPALATLSTGILDALAAPFLVDGTTLFARASIGATWIEPDDNSDEVLRRADQAMYTAKGRGKGTFQLFGDLLDVATRRAGELRADLQGALIGGELELHYQPIVDLASGRAVAAEALLRWRHPRFGAIDPLEALAVAADTGLAELLEAWTIEQACATAAAMRRHHPGFWVAVNLSATPVEAGLLETVRTALAAGDVDPDALTIEITENLAVQSMNGALTDLTRLGVRLAIDDFGTGYSSLSRLDSLPIDIVKVDRSFIARMLGSEASPLAHMVLEIGDALDIDTIAEGVETWAQHDHLVARGCRFGQGFLYGGAVPAADLPAALMAVEIALLRSDGPAGGAPR